LLDDLTTIFVGYSMRPGKFTPVYFCAVWKQSCNTFSLSIEISLSEGEWDLGFLEAGGFLKE
jgi:hypothetical protein